MGTKLWKARTTESKRTQERVSRRIREEQAEAEAAQTVGQGRTWGLVLRVNMRGCEQESNQA